MQTKPAADQGQSTALIRYDNRKIPTPYCTNLPAVSPREEEDGVKTLKVLIPINDQDSALYALESAMARAWPAGTQFRLLTVVEDLLDGVPEDQIVHRDILLAEQVEYQQAMKKWLTRINESFSVCFANTQVDIESGRIAETICENAADWEADYILVGSHDLNPESRLALGSISSKVLKSSPCDIEAVRFRKLRHILESGRAAAPEEIRSLASHAPRRVIVASDLSQQAALAVDWVAESNWLDNTEIKLVTVTEEAKCDPCVLFLGGSLNYFSAHRHQIMVQDQLRLLGKRIVDKHPKCKVEAFVIESTSVSDAIMDLASSWDVDLVVVGSQGAGCSGKAEVGSNATKIMDSLECSVIAIKPSSRDQAHFSWYAGLQ
jgi:nucleotide-binding universal stress UspA family protein